MKTMQTDVIKRFMSDTEFAEFVEKYQAHKLELRTTKQYDAEDWKMFETNAPIEEFMKKWDVSKERTIYKLGQMVLKRKV